MKDLLPDIFRALLLFIGGGGLYKLGDYIARKRKDSRLAPVEQGNAITALADALTKVAHDSVENMAEDLKRARTELREGRDQMQDMGRRMEQREAEHTKRETEHATLMERMKKRIAQLVQVLERNHIEVPPPEDED